MITYEDWVLPSSLVLDRAVEEFNDARNNCWCYNGARGDCDVYFNGLCKCDRCLLCCNYAPSDEDIIVKCMVFARLASEAGYKITRRGFRMDPPINCKGNPKIL